MKFIGGKLGEIGLTQNADLSNIKAIQGCRSGLGCKRSLVQIQSRRPFQIPDFTQLTYKYHSQENAGKYAYLCSNSCINSHSSGGKLGECPDLKLYSGLSPLTPSLRRPINRTLASQNSSRFTSPESSGGICGEAIH